MGKNALMDIQNGLIEKGFLNTRTKLIYDQELITALRNYQIANKYISGVYTHKMLESLRAK